MNWKFGVEQLDWLRINKLLCILYNIFLIIIMQQGIGKQTFCTVRE